MLIAYIISVVLCFVLCILAAKYHDGKVTIGDFLLFLGVSLVPGFNVMGALVGFIAFIDGLNGSGFLDKKIW